MTRAPYPLQWPSGWKRTPAQKRESGRFKVGLATARDKIAHELDLLGAANAVLTSDLPTRIDGRPYADGRSNDPAIAVWFVLDGHERVMACDRWDTHAANMQAIALSINAMRGLTRWGASDLVNRAFTGFSALPAPGETSEGIEGPAPGPVKRPWREVLGGPHADLCATWPDLPPDELLLLARGRHRRLIKEIHPDKGGSLDLATEVNVALEEATAELEALMRQEDSRG